MWRWCALLAVAALAACAEPPTTAERVERIGLPGAARFEIATARGEARVAARLQVPYRAELCLEQPGSPQARIEIGLLAPGTRVRSRLAARYAEATGTAHGARWTELRVTLPPKERCAELTLRGPGGAEVLVSKPLGIRPGARRPWVVLYVVDTLRFDATPYAGAADASGVWERLASDAIVYRRALSTSSWTRPSVATLLTGLGPSFHRVFDRQDRLPSGMPRLPVWLAEAGYATAAFSTNPNVLPEWGFLGGFDRFVDIDAESWLVGQDFEGLERRLLAFVESQADRPLFLYVHDNQPHVPYRPPPALRKMLGAPAPGHRAESPPEDADPALLKEAQRLYAGDVLATGQRLDAFLDTLEALARREDAVLVVVGDHGEEFGEHGGLFHGKTLYQEQLHVPLVLKPPASRDLRGSVEAPVSLEDLAPTLVEWLELPAPPSVSGRRLPLPGEKVAADAALIAELDLDGRGAQVALRWPYKYLRERGGRERLFDLEADPDERSDLSAERPAELAALREAVAARQAAATRGLGVACVAGARPARVRVEVLASSLGPERLTRLGLEARDSLELAEDGVSATWLLRPAAEGRSRALPTTRDLARAQPDRDGLRIRGPLAEGSAIRVTPLNGSTPLRVEGPEGEELPTGTSIALSSLRSAAAPGEPESGEDARCRLHYLEAAREPLPEGELDETLRQRLRALGYME